AEHAEAGVVDEDVEAAAARQAIDLEDGGFDRRVRRDVEEERVELGGAGFRLDLRELGRLAARRDDVVALVGEVESRHAADTGGGSRDEDDLLSGGHDDRLLKVGGMNIHSGTRVKKTRVYARMASHMHCSAV